MWKTEPNTDSFLDLCQLHISGPNPEKNYVCLKIEFTKDLKEKVFYPTEDQFANYFIQNPVSLNYNLNCLIQSELEVAQFEQIISKDSLTELSNQEKQFIWENRNLCLQYSNSLDKLLQSVLWIDKSYLLELYSLLATWPELRPADAILVLHSSYIDVNVRDFAVRCLDKCMRDEEFEFYILQLVQVFELSNNIQK